MSPVKHSLCSRTSGGRPSGLPISSAICSPGISGVRNATISASSAPTTGRCARVAMVSRAASSCASISPGVSTSAADSPARAKNAGSTPPIRARRKAAAPASVSARWIARNGPFIGVSRSNCGSASAVAIAKSIHGTRSTSTGASGAAASSWLASLSVAERPAESKSGALASGSNAASRGGSAVSIGSSASVPSAPAIATGQPRRNASIASAVLCASPGMEALISRTRS